mgnify:CR=1 FL=1
MKIILLQSVRALGNPGDIVNVKSGYARNYLIPHKLAVYANKGNISRIEYQIEQSKAIEEQRIIELQKIADKLDKVTLKFELKAGEDDKLFGSVTSSMICEAIDEQGYKVDKKEIYLEEPNKHLGNHFVEVHLDHELSAKIKIKVSSTE